VEGAQRLTTADRKRIEKLAALVDDLKAGKDYSITRLTSIKTLCKDHVVACNFTAWLASLAAEKIAARKRRPSHIPKAKWTEIRKLAADGFAALRGNKSNDHLREVLYRVREVQNEVERHRWADIRIIQSGELLQIELALECHFDAVSAPVIAYEAARRHAERYNSRYGTGLIPESAEPLQEIVNYFTRHKTSKSAHRR